MSGPLFSIATPTRNSLDKLKRCVGSLRGQTGLRFEHLVHDACSSDGSGAWLHAQTVTHPELKPLSQPDEGMYDAINQGWSRATGTYLAWLNSDEQYLPGTLALVADFFQSHPEVDAVFGDYLVVDPTGRAVALRREIPLRKFYVSNTFLYAQSCTMFFRRQLWDAGRLRLDSRLRYAADKDLVLRLMTAGVRIKHLPRVLSIFGIDGSNLSLHAGMAQEAEMLRLAYGGFRWRPLRSLAYGARRLERLARGSYRPVDLRYRFALDEIPNYTDYLARGLGGRYNLSNITGRAVVISAPSSDIYGSGRTRS